MLGFITMGIIGFTNYEVTMTVIIVGPIVLALGVSYGLHITNSYAENKGLLRRKSRKHWTPQGERFYSRQSRQLSGSYLLHSHLWRLYKPSVGALRWAL